MHSTDVPTTSVRYLGSPAPPAGTEAAHPVPPQRVLAVPAAADHVSVLEQRRHGKHQAEHGDDRDKHVNLTHVALLLWEWGEKEEINHLNTIKTNSYIKD